MKKFLLFIVVVVIAIGGTAYWYVSRITQESAPLVAAEETRRVVATGDVVGYLEENGAAAWLGIPFAAPPVGDLRWRAPRDAPAWNDTLEAVEFASSCPQRGMAGGSDGPAISGAEDCLYLNVWEPPAADPGRPVMVWIHGGGNHIGEAGTPIYNGANLAATHDVVVVTINYRLGPLGWLTHPGLRDAADPADNSGNYGTLDIVKALTWVRDNVAQFNGDPDNVTIFGESAGGFNVLSMMVSPLASGLYHKAVVQSGGLTLLPLSVAENYRDAEPPGHNVSSRELVNSLLVAAGRATDRDAAKSMQQNMSDAEVAALLRESSAADLLRAQGGAGMSGTPYLFADGHVLPMDGQVPDLFSDTSLYNVTPVVLGTNRDEVKLFMAMSPDATERAFGIPYRVKDVEAYNRDAAYGSDAWKIRGVDSLAAQLRDTQGTSVFAYRFDWDELRTLASMNLSDLFGAAHAFEIPFVFGNFELVDNTMIIADEDIPARDALARSMMSYWAEFAHSGYPGRGRDGQEVEWVAWENGAESRNRLLILDSQNDGGIRMSSERLTMDDLRARLLADTSFPTQDDHCAAYRRMFEGEAFVQSEYENLGSGGCAD